MKKPDLMAYCWASGQILFGPKVPKVIELDQLHDKEATWVIQWQEA